MTLSHKSQYAPVIINMKYEKQADTFLTRIFPFTK